MTREPPRARRIEPSPGQPAWLIEGPVTVLPEGDIWTRIASSLGANPAARRLVCGTLSLTGGDLLDGVDGFLPLPASSRIGVHVARSAALVQTVLAIWSRGSTYVPMATEHPPARIAALIASCRPEAIVTDGDPRSFDGYEITGERVVLDRRLFVLTRISATAAETGSRSAIGYVAHTSGSTGAPKAVLVPHRALLNRMTAMRRLVSPSDADIVLFKTSLAFDVHIWEFTFPLVFGCLLVVYPQERFFDLRAVADLIVRARVTLAGFVPTLLSSLLDRPDFIRRNELRLVFCGGEGWTAGLASRFHDRLPRCELRNSYGPAETTLAVANWLVPRDASVSCIEIGAPLDNTVFMIEETSRDHDQVMGTLCVGGAQVAAGYLCRVAVDPFFSLLVDGTSTAFYRTGDVVELDVTTGALHFRGRLDSQIKLNGVRIELAEIEAAIMTLEPVEACVAALASHGGVPCLLATYKTHDNAPLDMATVRNRCAGLLPPTHVPTQFRQTDAFALNLNGKIDRARIQAA